MSPEQGVISRKQQPESWREGSKDLLSRLALSAVLLRPGALMAPPSPSEFSDELPTAVACPSEPIWLGSASWGKESANLNRDGCCVKVVFDKGDGRYHVYVGPPEDCQDNPNI